MNERIKELAEGADQLAEDELVHLERVHNRLYSFTESREIYNQKFAELIVKECIGCCERVISDPVPKDIDTWLNGGEHCIQEIEEHFGLGMSIEDKKQLIKDLLGVSNDTKS